MQCSPVATKGVFSERYQVLGRRWALLKDAMQRAASAATDIGAAALLVHAIDQAAVLFHAQYNFKAFPEGTRTLFLPIKTIVAAL